MGSKCRCVFVVVVVLSFCHFVDVMGKGMEEIPLLYVLCN